MRRPALTHEQRTARSAVRRAFARRFVWRSALGALALALLVVVVAWWLLTTIGGRDVLLRQIVARLPAGATLRWTRASGPASGPLVLHGVRFQMPRAADPDCVRSAREPCAAGLIVFTARTVVLDPALRPLLGRRLRLDALAITDATLALPANTQPFKLPRWPDSLPNIAPPMALQADAFHIHGLRVTRGGQPLIDVHQARGGVSAQTGALQIDHLSINSDRGRFTLDGDYAPGAAYRTDLVASARFPAPSNRIPARMGLVARGDLSHLVVALAGTAPAPLHALLSLDGKDNPRWQLRASSEAVDTNLLTGADVAATPWAFALQVNGIAGAAHVQGRVAHGGLSAVIQPSTIALRDQVLDVQPLVVGALGGRTTLRGQVNLRDPRNAAVRLSVNARGLSWGGTGTGAIHGDADFGLAGKPDAWAASGMARLARNAQHATLQFDGGGDLRHVDVHALRARMPTGTLDASGRIAWSPMLAWSLQATLAGFDPGYFAPGWDGAVDGRITSSGSLPAAGELRATVDVPHVGGRLRGRALRGHAAFVARGTQYRGDLDLGIGNSQVQARGLIGDTLDVTAVFAPLQLADLLPSATGVVRGTLHLSGPRRQLDIDADLTGNALRVAGYRADSVTVHGRLPWRNAGGALVLDASGVQAGATLQHLHAQTTGSMQALHVSADARGNAGTVALTARVGQQGAAWRGTLESLRLAPARGAPWQLQSPATVAHAGNRWTLGRACLASTGGAACVSADWPAHGADLDTIGLPLALAVPWLPPRADARPWLLDGALDITAHLRPLAGSWQATVHATSAAGGLRNSAHARSDLVAYSQLLFDATLDPRQVQASLRAGLNGNGHVDARIATGRDAYAPLSGQIALDTSALTWMELLSPDIVEPTGHLDAHLVLGGTRAQPALSGNAQLSAFETELPALAITLRAGNLRLDALPDGSARLHGSVQSGDGTLALDGTLGWRTGDTPMVLSARGRNVLASDTRDLHAVIDPDVVVRYAPGHPLQVTGRVGVPSARLDLERLDRGVASSPDVVVVDPVPGERAVATPLVLDLTLALGDDVRLHGFGLDGTLGGSLQVRAQPGREMRATGVLDVGGHYLAYGQKLDIIRGRLAWSNTAVGDPLLDIRAQRVVGDVTAGIDVRGRASQPQASVWSDPATDQSQALAYLALGRPLSSASGDESRQLGAASAALTAGGNLLAAQLGTRLGLDNAGVTNSRALGGSVLGVGKYLSPKLYVGYGVSLLGTGQVLTLKYLLRRGFDMEIESSTVENRASLNWRKEK